MAKTKTKKKYPKYGDEETANAIKSRAKLISKTHKPKAIGPFHIPGYGPKGVIRTSLKVRKANIVFGGKAKKCRKEIEDLKKVPGDIKMGIFINCMAEELGGEMGEVTYEELAKLLKEEELKGE